MMQVSMRIKPILGTDADGPELRAQLGSGLAASLTDCGDAVVLRPTTIEANGEV